MGFVRFDTAGSVWEIVCVCVAEWTGALLPKGVR